METKMASTIAKIVTAATVWLDVACFNVDMQVSVVKLVAMDGISVGQVDSST